MVQPWTCTAEVVRCREPGAPPASPRSSLQRCWAWIGWQHFSFLHIWNKKVRETEVPFLRLWSESVSQLGLKGDLQSSLLSNGSERLLLIGDEYNEVERRHIFKRVSCQASHVPAQSPR